MTRDPKRGVLAQKLDAGLLASVLLVIAITSIYLVPLSHIHPLEITYSYHIKLAERMVKERIIPSPHFLYQALVSFTHVLLPFISYQVAGFFVVPIATACGLGLIVHRLIRQTLDISKSSKLFVWSIVLVLALLLVTCISLFTYPRLYLGYMAVTEFYSATTLLAKPFSLLLFIYICGMLGQSESKSWEVIGLTAMLTVLSLLAKPSYVICLLPATFVLIVYRLFRKQAFSWLSISLGLYLPSILVLGWQYYFSYLEKETIIMDDYGKSGIIFAPLAVMSFHSKMQYVPLDPGLFSSSYTYRVNASDCQLFGLSYSCDLLRDFILSILFPLVVYAFYFKQTRKSFVLNFVWVIFLISAFYTYFLAEAGSRMYAGNFLWSGQITLFILFVFSTIFLIKEPTFESFLGTRLGKKQSFADFLQWAKKFAKPILCCVIFGLHFVSGLLHYEFVSRVVFIF